MAKDTAGRSLRLNGQNVCYWCMKEHTWSEDDCPNRQREAFDRQQERIRYITEGPKRPARAHGPVGLNTGAGVEGEDGQGFMPLGSEFPMMLDFDPNEPREAGYFPGEGE